MRNQQTVYVLVFSLALTSCFSTESSTAKVGAPSISSGEVSARSTHGPAQDIRTPITESDPAFQVTANDITLVKSEIELTPEEEEALK